MATIRLTPSTYYLSNSTYLKVTDASNMYTNTSSTTYGTITHNRSATTAYYAYLRGFNFDDIPEGAIIKSFTIKLKARESGLSTASTYAPGIYNGTTALDGTFGSLSTSQQVLSCTGVTASFDTIKGYGANFGIRIPLRRASSGTSGNVRVYGAEIAVNYSIPVTISFNANGGTGQMADVTTYGVGDSYPLPACTFTPPAGVDQWRFDHWTIGGTSYAVGDEAEITGDTTAVAQWIRPTIYIKTGSGWVPMDAGYEKETGAWAPKGMSALFQSGNAYRKGTEES